MVSICSGGWIQITNYIVCGVLLLVFAIGLRRVLRTGRGSTWGPILLGIFGLNFIGLGIFVTDPVLGYPPGAPSTPTVHGTLHILFGQLQFISLIAACFVLARRDAADPAERGWAWYSVATGLLVAVSDVVFVLTAKLLDGGPAGLISRIGIIVGWSWIALLAIHLMSKKVPRVSVEYIGLRSFGESTCLLLIGVTRLGRAEHTLSDRCSLQAASAECSKSF